jgi:DNA-binding transcriptional LysR family regulator
VSFVRLPIDRQGLSVIRLYGEVPVLVVSRDSALADRESVSVDEVAAIADVRDYPTTESTKDAVALVAAGVGALRLPHSVARMAARKDVVALPIDGAPETEIAVCWPQDETTPLVEEFIGIVRGRTVASSRTSPTPPTPRTKAPERGRRSGGSTPQRSGGKRATGRPRRGSR